MESEGTSGQRFLGRGERREGEEGEREERKEEKGPGDEGGLT